MQIFSLWRDIEVRLMGELSAAERAEMELEENLQRHDLSAYERSKTLVQLNETAKEVTEDEELRADATQNSPPRQRGRPKKAGSRRDVERRTGIDEATMRQAEKHLAAVEHYPALGAPEATQREVLDLAKALDALPVGEAAGHEAADQA